MVFPYWVFFLPVFLIPNSTTCFHCFRNFQWLPHSLQGEVQIPRHGTKSSPWPRPLSFSLFSFFSVLTFFILCAPAILIFVPYESNFDIFSPSLPTHIHNHRNSYFSTKSHLFSFILHLGDWLTGFRVWLYNMIRKYSVIIFYNFNLLSVICGYIICKLAYCSPVFGKERYT